MATHHTPGEWRLDGNMIKAGPNGRHLFRIEEQPGQGDAAQDNRQILVAGPRLLEVMMRIAAMNPSHTDAGTLARNEAREVIEEITGEPWPGR
jgi:hypothetical protein